MKFRFSLRQCGIGILAVCLACAFVGGSRRFTLNEIKQERMLMDELERTTDSIHFRQAAEPGTLEKLACMIDRKEDLSRVDRCMVSFTGFSNSLDFKRLHTFKYMSVLELYQCKLKEEDWESLSRHGGLSKVQLSAGTLISQQGRELLDRASIEIEE